MTESEERYALLPVEQCAIHPLARIRFEYEVDELAKSIGAIGQVQPGKVVDNGTTTGTSARYLVYIGCRRLEACKKVSGVYFKALAVREIDDGRLQRELLTENMKRANLSVLEELNLLANYSKHQFSLDDLSKDLDLSPKFVRARVKLAVLVQDRRLTETLYKIERISGYRFTHRHIEKIMTLEEGKWLPLAIQAAELNWKADDIESLGTQFSIQSLIEALPEWGRSLLPTQALQIRTVTKDQPAGIRAGGSGVPSVGIPKTEENTGKREEEDQGGESPSRYQTIARSAYFLICPKCGSESVIEVPKYPDVTLLRIGKPETGRNAIPVAKESIPLQLALAFVTCTNEGCGKSMILALDESGDEVVLAKKKDLLSIMGGGAEPEDGGRGALVWDEKEEGWLKSQSDGHDSIYYRYDEQAKRWVIPVTIGKQATARPLE